MKYIDYDFEEKYQEIEGTSRPITISGDVKSEVKYFKYLGSF
jgi:hypothetical protein